MGVSDQQDKSVNTHKKNILQFSVVEGIIAVKNEQPLGH